MHFTQFVLCIFIRYRQMDFKLLAEALKLEPFAIIHAHIISRSKGEREPRQIDLKRHKLPLRHLFSCSVYPITQHL